MLKNFLKQISIDIGETALALDSPNEVISNLEAALGLIQYKKAWIKEVKKIMNDPYLVIEGDRKNIKKYKKVFQSKQHETGVKFDKISYVRIDCFNDETVQRIKTYLLQCDKRQLIIDIRKCGGGTLASCVWLLRFFLKNDFLIIKYKNKRTIYSEDIEPALNFRQIAVWVSKETISTGEIFAYSLRTKTMNSCCLIGSQTAQKKFGQTTVFDKKCKIYISYSSFTWEIPNITKGLDYYIQIDNDEKVFNSIDDYYKKTLEYFRITLE